MSYDKNAAQARWRQARAERGECIMTAEVRRRLA